MKAGFQLSRGEFLEWAEELQSEVNRGLQALAEYLFKAWRLPGSVEDLRKEIGLESSQQVSTEACGAEKESEPEEATDERIG